MPTSQPDLMTECEIATRILVYSTKCCSFTETVPYTDTAEVSPVSMHIPTWWNSLSMSAFCWVCHYHCFYTPNGCEEPVATRGCVCSHCQHLGKLNRTRTHNKDNFQLPVSTLYTWAIRHSSRVQKGSVVYMLYHYKKNRLQKKKKQT